MDCKNTAISRLLSLAPRAETISLTVDRFLSLGGAGDSFYTSLKVARNSEANCRDN